jgi:hypothetical protein
MQVNIAGVIAFPSEKMNLKIRKNAIQQSGLFKCSQVYLDSLEDLHVAVKQKLFISLLLVTPQVLFVLLQNSLFASRCVLQRKSATQLQKSLYDGHDSIMHPHQRIYALMSMLRTRLNYQPHI